MNEWQKSRLAEVLYLLNPTSGATTDYARGAFVGAISLMFNEWNNIPKYMWETIIPLIPNDFRFQAIPPAALDCVSWSFPTRQVTKFPVFIGKVPENVLSIKVEDPPTWTCRDKILNSYLRIIQIMEREFSKAESKKDIFCALTPLQKQGRDYIAYFEISDNSKELRNSYNFHGQNTSRWLFAGALVVGEDGRVSIHS